jgi:hypothetical protein
MTIPSPCYGCADRADGCHGKCVRYSSYRRQLEEIHRAREGDRIVEEAIGLSMIRAARWKFKHKRKWGGR